MKNSTTILAMTDALFIQRRRIIGMLYEAREVIGTYPAH